MSNIAEKITNLGKQAKAISNLLALLPTDIKNKTIKDIAQNINQEKLSITKANAIDIKNGEQKKLSSPLLDRLTLTTERIQAMIDCCHQVITQKDPVGEISESRKAKAGFQIAKMRVPLGVIGIIYESRPNVTLETSILSLKSGNSIILRGGSEALYSNIAIWRCITKALEDNGISTHAIQLIDFPNRDAVGELIKMSDYVDVIIPRGGLSLIQRISKDATIPVLKHLDGICHVYIDKDADLTKAEDVAYNAKTRRYSICGAMETLLVAEPIAAKILPKLCNRYSKKGVMLYGCPKSQKYYPNMLTATVDSWKTEYLDAKLSIKVVENIDEAINHINTYGSHHTDSIVTENQASAQKFLRRVDSSSVMHNVSTQFADGFEYGLGAEIGISTGKLHARGPVSLEALTSQKYIIQGQGETRP